MVLIIINEEFEQYVKQYERLIFTMCYAMTHNYFDSENLAQETFLSAYKNYHMFHGDNIKSWLCRIASNKCKDYLKRPERKRMGYIEDEGMGIMVSEELTEDIVLKKDCEERIKNICLKLKEPYQTASIKYYLQNKSVNEIADEMGRNKKTVQTWIYRARGLLKNLWEGEM